jgi:hypothetical protein
MPGQNDEDRSEPQSQSHTPALNRSEQRSQSANRRLHRHGKWVGIVVALVVVAAIAVITAASSDGSPVRSASPRGATPARRVDALLEGIPEAEAANDEQTAADLDFHETPSFLIGHKSSADPEKLLWFSVSETAAFNSAVERTLAEIRRSTSERSAYSGTTDRIVPADWATSTDRPHKESTRC